MNKKKTLVVEGGGFRTAFTAGVLDAFMVANYVPFERMIGVSGGALALSYFLSGQYRTYYSAMKHLSKDAHFIKWNRVLSPEGYMDIEYLRKMAQTTFKFDIEKALDAKSSRELWFVATNKKTGEAEFLEPNESTWVDCVIASSTLPFVTKGAHQVEGKVLMDGGWSDPLPVKKAIELGTEDLLIIRTNPRDIELTQSWPDYFASIYYRDNAEFSACFTDNYDRYNHAVRFLNNPPEDISVHQIAPAKYLESSTYSYSKSSVGNDYRYGLDMGMQYLMQIQWKGKNHSEVSVVSEQNLICPS